MKSAQILALLILILQTTNQQCAPIISGGGQPNANISGLQSSAVTLIGGPKAKRQNQFNVTLQSNLLSSPDQLSTYEVALGLNYMQNYYDANQLNFMARVVIQPTYFTIVFIISEQSTWTAAQIHYLATTRNDMRGGNFLVDKPALLMAYKKPMPKIMAISKDFGKWNGASKYMAAYAFISGIQTKSRAVDVDIQAVTANATSNTLNVIMAFNNMDMGIEYLALSYIIYCDANNLVDIQPLTSALGSIQNTFRTTKNNQFIGITNLDSINLNSYFSKPRSISQSFNKTQLQAYALAFELQGFSFTTRQFTQGPVVRLSAGGTPLNSSCANYTECKLQGGIFLTNQNQKLCVICRPNSEYNPTTKTCNCLDEYYADQYQNCVSLSSLCQKDQFYYEGICYKMSTQPSSGRCSPYQIYNLTSQSCICRPGFLYYYVDGKNKCSPPCPDGLSFDYKQQKCVCLSNQSDEIGNCINCQDDLVQWNKTTNKCQCVAGAMNFLGKCLSCSPYSKYNPNTKKCDCNQGYSGSGVICRKAQSIFSLNSTTFTIFYMPPPTNK